MNGSECSHERRSPPPPGKRLEVCLDCGGRVIECSSCSATTTAAADIADSGWMKTRQQDGLEHYHCPDCWSSRRG